MQNQSPKERLREHATEATATTVTGIWMLGLFTGQSWWLPALLVGYLVVVPLVALLYGDEADREEWVEEMWHWDEEDDEYGTTDRHAEDSSPSSDEALQSLRDRYARGELTDEQFERKLDRLLATETIEDLEDRRERKRERARD